MSEKEETRVVLVDESDRAVGEEEKLAAHRDGGKLHRAFSIFIENDRGELLLQRRAAVKYHFRGLWANACCGHPKPGEPLEAAARRRVREELGIDVALRESFSFTYTAEDAESGLTERELDHVFIGRFDGMAEPHPDEIDAIRWVRPDALERELDERPERFAPWFREAAPRVLASLEGEPRPPRTRTVAARRRRRLFGVLSMLFLVFLATIVLRAPWRGYLAKGDLYATAQGLRWLRTWYRDGAWPTSFALVLTPPTDEYQGDAKLYKWALPGHLMLVHAWLWLFELEPTVDLLMRVNLAIHLALAVLLALLAHQLAILARPESLRWPALAALGCGLFVLLYPTNLYWGQSLSCQYFTVLPLLVVTVGGRWLRASFPAEARARIDRIVAVTVFFGTITDFLFWVLVPCLVLQRGLRARRGRPRTSDPWRKTLAGPYLAAFGFLFVVFVLTGQIPAMIGRARAWTIGEQGGGLLFFVLTRFWFLGTYFTGHFYDAFALLGFFCIGLALWKLVLRRRRDALPWMARGVLLDLLLPGLLFTFVLSPHQAAHSFAPMQYVPFIALAWAFLTPITIAGLRGRLRKAAWVVYGALAFLLIWPGSSGYQKYFADPEVGWTLEATFLRENTTTSDVVFSPTTEIDILPPQRIALGERAVHHVYGPLDILRRIEEVGDVPTVAIYGPPDRFYALGAGYSPVRRGSGLTVTRFPVERFREFLDARPDAAFRARLRDVVEGGLRPMGELEPDDAERRAPERPVALHVVYGPGAGGGAERLYWKDASHYHTVSPDGDVVVAGDDIYRDAFLGVWQKAEKVNGRAAELGAYLLSAFESSEPAVRFDWNGYDVVRRGLGPPPAALEQRAPAVASWDAYLVYSGETPVAMALGPSGGGTAWVGVVFDDVLSAFDGWFEVFEEWKIIKRPDAS